MAAPDGLVVAVLAAGRSQRFGAADKLSAELAGKPLLHWAADVGRSINAAQHLLVTGPNFAAQDLPSGYGHLVNEAPSEGLASSLRIAAAHSRNASALLILLGDMPRVTAAHLQAILSLHIAHPDRAIFSSIPGGSPQPPALFPATLLPVVEAMSGDSGARILATDALFVAADADLLVDVDTPDDLAHCAALLAAAVDPKAES